MTKYLTDRVDIPVPVVLVRHVQSIPQAHVQVQVQQNVRPGGQEDEGALVIVRFGSWSFYQVDDQPHQRVHGEDSLVNDEHHLWYLELWNEKK